MSADEFVRLMSRALDEVEHFWLLVDAIELLDQDAKFVEFSHDHYLPAAAAYRELVRGKTQVSSHRFHSVTGRLGGYSRWMYARQETLFTRLASIVMHQTPEPLRRPFVDHAWRHFKAADRKWLAAGRKRQLCCSSLE
jgi:hypothetical protein